MNKKHNENIFDMYIQITNTPHRFHWKNGEQKGKATQIKG